MVVAPLDVVAGLAKLLLLAWPGMMAVLWVLNRFEGAGR